MGAGQVEIVALDGQTLVLVGVDTKRSGQQGGGRDVSATAGRRLRNIATAYIEANNLGDMRWRFDQITLLVVAEDRALLRHRRDALALGE